MKITITSKLKNRIMLIPNLFIIEGEQKDIEISDKERVNIDKMLKGNKWLEKQVSEKNIVFKMPIFNQTLNK